MLELSEKTRYDQDSKLVNLVIVASQVLLNIRKSELKPYCITPEGARILRAVSVLKENATRAEIARCLFREPNTVFDMVRRMEKKGLVTMTQAPDSNSRIVVLTEKGKQVYHDISERKAKSLRQLTSHLSDQEEQELITQLETLTNRLFQQLGARRMPPDLDL